MTLKHNCYISRKPVPWFEPGTGGFSCISSLVKMGLEYYAKPGIGYQFTRMSPFILMFVRSFGLTHRTQCCVSFACQCRTVTRNMYAVFFFVPTQSAIEPPCESDFKNVGCRSCVLLNSPTAALSFCLLIACRSFVLLGRCL